MHRNPQRNLVDYLLLFNVVVKYIDLQRATLTNIRQIKITVGKNRSNIWSTKMYKGLSKFNSQIHSSFQTASQKALQVPSETQRPASVVNNGHVGSINAFH